MKRILLVLLLLALSACSAKEDFCGGETYGYCDNDADCETDGCSGEVCRSASETMFFSDCEDLACYDAEKYSISCSCIDNECQWA